MTATLSEVVPNAVEDKTQRLLEEACRRNLTLATAESCTGGLLASLLTDVEGCSHAFERGFVVYTDGAKAGMLGIPRPLIQEHGAVSRDVALAMAAGGLAHSSADIVVAITGFAGRGKPEDEPGLVHLACVRRGRPPVHREEHFGDIGRGGVRLACLDVALEMIEEALA